MVLERHNRKTGQFQERKLGTALIQADLILLCCFALLHFIGIACCYKWKVTTCFIEMLALLRSLLYCGGLELDPQYLQGIPVYLIIEHE